MAQVRSAPVSAIFANVVLMRKQVNRDRLSRSPLVKWLFVLVLIAAQGVALAHQADHSFYADSCSVCSAVQDLDAVLVVAPDHFTISYRCASDTTLINAPRVYHQPSSDPIRAPPAP